MAMRTSLGISVVVTLLFLFAAGSVAKAQGCDVPPTACAMPLCSNDPNSDRYCRNVACTSIGGASGFCTAPCKCGATSYGDQQGQQQGVGDAKGMMDALKGIMDMLKQAMEKKGGGGQGQQPQQGQQGLPQGCTQYYQVTAPSADPCAYYVPPTSDSLLQTTGLGSIGSDSLLDALEGGGALNVSEGLLGGDDGSTAGETSAGESAGEASDAKTTAGSKSPTSGAESQPIVGENLSGEQVNLKSGTRGNIVVTEGGATIITQTLDLNANTEVAGFYGSDSSGGEPQGIIARMCRNRPWASSIVSFVIPPVFFDSLCAWRGYQVGSPAPPSQPVVDGQLTPSSTAARRAAAARPQVDVIEPRVEIWAVPATVPLGTRTSVFWNTSGVETCSITSLDGSFNETSLSGGASTVSLAGPTTFTIVCLSPSGRSMTDFVIVNLAI